MHKHDYVLYLESDLNRVYSNTLGSVAAAELAVVLGATTGTEPGAVTVAQRDRAHVLSFGSDLAPEEIGPVAGRLSATLALFESRGEALVPVSAPEQLRFGTDLVTTQRYKGKTNERFTRAMLNMALALSGSFEAVTVADPMCGRGTTLNWVLAYGGDAIGIEPDRNALDQYANFISQWAKRSRLPHRLQDFRPANAERRYASLAVAPSRRELNGDGAQTVELFCSHGGDTDLPIKRQSIDAIVTDLPYGIQHAGRATGERRNRWDRPDTIELLSDLLPAWRRWLRPGGALVFAWNTKRAGAAAVKDLVVEAGFTLHRPDDPTIDFAHRVDASIERDVVLAVR